MRLLLSAAVLCVLSAPAGAETELSFFGSANAAVANSTNLVDPGGAGRLSFSGDWEIPETAGVRVTWWRESDFGWGVELNATSAEALPRTLAANGLNDLSLETGVSLFTLNAFHRWPEKKSRLRPYVGAGVGVSVPTVIFEGGGTPTNSRQVTGPAMQLMAGASYALNDQMSLFGEVQGAYSVNTADLASGGTLETNLLTNGVNVGVSLGF